MNDLTEIIRIRVSAEDLAYIQAEAAQARLNVSSWARNKLLASGQPTFVLQPNHTVHKIGEVMEILDEKGETK